MVDILYSLIDFICIFILQVILYRVKIHPFFKGNTKIKDKAFIRFITITSFFCLADAFWGSMASHQFAVKLETFKTLTLITYTLLALVPYQWFFYVQIYSGNYSRKNKILNFVYLIPFFVNFILLLVNIWNPILYRIERNLVIYPGPHRILILLIPVLYYAFTVIQLVVLAIKTEDKELKHNYLILSLYAITIIAFTLLEYFLNDGPFAALGFMISTFAVYIFNTSREKEKLLIHSHEAENLLKLETNELVLSTVANQFIILLVFNMKGGAPSKIKGTELYEDLINQISDPRMIFPEMLKRFVTPEYLEEMLIFANKSSVAQRLEGSNAISKDFLSKDEGWCRAMWFRLKDDDDGKLESAIFGVRVIDKDKKREVEYQEKLKRALKNQNEIFGEMLRMQSNGMLATDMQNEILMINETAAKIFGFSTPENVTSIDDIFLKTESENKDEIRSKLHKIKMNGGKYAFQFSVTDINGNPIHYIAESKLTHLSNGSKVILTSFADITKNKKMEQDLVILSETDALTGINNRGSGERKIEYLLSTGKTGMFGILDADKFKSINDNYGHVVGDRVIIRIAESLRKTFRDRDIIMRLGGDEFAVFAVGITEEKDAKLCIQRFFESIDDIQIPEMGEKKISVSLGVVLCTEIETKSFDDYYQMADRAMYVSKKYDGNHFEFCKNIEEK